MDLKEPVCPWLAPNQRGSPLRDPLWRRFLKDLLAVTSLVGVSLCTFVPGAILCGENPLPPAWQLWASAIAATPFMSILGWRFFGRPLNPSNILRMGTVAFTIASLVAVMYLLPLDERRGWGWVCPMLAIYCAFAIDRFLPALTGRGRTPSDTSSAPSDKPDDLRARKHDSGPLLADPHLHLANPITKNEWFVIGLGAIFGFVFLYAVSHSILAALVLGIPPAMGGVALVLLLIRKFPLRSYIGRSPDAKTSRLLMPRLILYLAAMLAVSAQAFISKPSAGSRVAIVAIDISVVGFFIHHRLSARAK